MLPEKDLLILKHLRNNARKTLTSISKETNIPTSTVFDRLRIHEKGIIKKYTSIIDIENLANKTVEPNFKYLILDKIEENSPASKPGLKIGDKIIALNSVSISNNTEELPAFGFIMGGTTSLTLKMQADTAGAVSSAVVQVTGADQNNATRAIRLNFFYEV